MRIVLVRHGRSGHQQSGWINRAEFLRWREAYEAAGIDADEVPPPELTALAATSGVVVASVTRRAVESAKLLAPGREVLTSPLLVELELHPPRLGAIRLPMFGWALSYGVRWLGRALLRRPHFAAGEEQRAREAAQWLRELAAHRGSVMAVTHASLRSLLTRELVRMGWRSEVPRGRLRHWSVWSLTRERTREVP